jgi:transcriptional regulator with XRE-family HTH domain
MDKSIYTPEYAQFLRDLRGARIRAGLTQAELGRRLKKTQSFISKCERGERRLDVLEARAFFRALGLNFADFVARLEHPRTRVR